MGKNLPAIQVWSLGQEDPMEKEMTTQSGVPAWRIPWTEEPGGLRPWGRKASDMTERLSNNRLSRAMFAPELGGERVEGRRPSPLLGQQPVTLRGIQDRRLLFEQRPDAPPASGPGLTAGGPA